MTNRPQNVTAAIHLQGLEPVTVSASGVEWINIDALTIFPGSKGQAEALAYCLRAARDGQLDKIVRMANERRAQLQAVFEEGNEDLVFVRGRRTVEDAFPGSFVGATPIKATS